MYKAKLGYIYIYIYIYIKLTKKKKRKKLKIEMAGEQICFQQHLKNVQCFGFTNVSWECIP